MQPPHDPIDAVTHRDPYPYYARLRERDDMTFDSRLGLWIASSARSVTAVLTHPDCHVRPAAIPVPDAIAEGAAGETFARLVRMNEGERHRLAKRVLYRALHDTDPADVTHQAQTQLRRLAYDPHDADALNRWLIELPVAVVAALLGIPSARLSEAVALTVDFVGCLSPLSDARRLEASHRAARQLNSMFQAMVSRQDAAPLLQRIRRADDGAWSDRHALVANLIGLLSQTCEATAGLIGNAIVALGARPALHSELRRHPHRVIEFLAEIGRYDPPVQNTRRFVGRDCRVAGIALREGDAILLLLAAANRDPQANPRPDDFLLQRRERCTFGFGHGRHLCPGSALALAIANHAVRELLCVLPDAPTNRWGWTYMPSVNGRIPRFSQR